ncbi:hypothetical protein ACFQ10_00540 [Streptomyces indonesiensis]
MSTAERASRATAIGAAAEVGSTTELGTVISRWIGRVIPHEGYMLAAVDPVTGAGCFLARQHGYSPAAARRLTLGDHLDGDHPFAFEQLVEGPCRVGVLNTDAPGPRRNAAMRAVMATKVSVASCVSRWSMREEPGAGWSCFAPREPGRSQRPRRPAPSGSAGTSSPR